jgi:hypothetical protein
MHSFGRKLRCASLAPHSFNVRAKSMTRASITNGIGLCVASSLILAIGMAALVVFEKHSYSESVAGLFISSFLFWAFLGVIFSFVGALAIGTPVAILLEKIHLFHWYVVMPVGAAISYLIGGSGFMSSEQNPYIQVTFAVYGAIGALAFWYGASSNKRSQRSAQSAPAAG